MKSALVITLLLLTVSMAPAVLADEQPNPPTEETAVQSDGVTDLALKPQIQDSPPATLQLSPISAKDAVGSSLEFLKLGSPPWEPMFMTCTCPVSGPCYFICHETGGCVSSTGSCQCC